MEVQNKPIKTFSQMEAWKACYQLFRVINALTKYFPKTEQFSLTDQLRRASISTTSNIAEGFAKQSYKEKLHFYSITLGSINEIQNQLLIAKECGYISSDEYILARDLSIHSHKITNGLIKKTKEIIRNS
jgi:four helix bundle protein